MIGHEVKNGAGRPAARVRSDCVCIIRRESFVKSLSWTYLSDPTDVVLAKE